MATIVPPFHALNVDFAYQLHFHVGFRTRRRIPAFRTQPRTECLRDLLADTCARSQYHLLESDIESRWVRLLLSLRPEHSPAAVVRTIKANTSRWLFESFPDLEQEMDRRTLWSREYYVRGVGDVTAQVVRAYIARQREHHEVEQDNARLLASYQHANPDGFLDLRPFSHGMAEYNCHLVCCPLRHVPAIDPAYAEELAAYLLQVARARKFDMLSLAIVDDHVHLFAALRPDQSPDFLVLTVMNNSSHWLSQRNPGAMKLWNAPGFWTPSAFLRTAGAATTNQVRAHLLSETMLPDEDG